MDQWPSDCETVVMDIRRNPFPSTFMTAPGGLEYLKMPMGLVQSTPGGELIPAGHHAIAHPNGTITHQHMTAQHAAAAVGAQQHARGKAAATTAQAINVAHPETHYVQANQVRYFPGFRYSLWFPNFR